MKNRNILKLFLLASLLFGFSTHSFASDIKFPKDWKNWPVSSSGTIPARNAKLPADLPLIVKKTFQTYSWVNNGKGSAYNLRVSPKQRSNFKQKRKYKNRPTAVLELTDIKVILVTGHLLNEPQYGAYSYDGKDMSSAHPSLAPKACVNCHTGFGEACKTGICNPKSR